MCLYLQCTWCMGSRRLPIASSKKSSGYFIIYNSSKKQRLATLEIKAHGQYYRAKNVRYAEQLCWQKTFITMCLQCKWSIDLEDNDRLQEFLLQILGDLYMVSQNKQLTEFLRNSFNLLSLLPADMNESILALVDLLWSQESHNTFTLSPDNKLN